MLARANRSKEILEVIVVVAIALGGDILFGFSGGRTGRVCDRILLAVAIEDAPLHGFRERADCVPGSFFKGEGLMLTELPAISMVPSEPVKISPSLSSPPSSKFHAQAEVETFAIVKQAQRDVGGLAAILQKRNPPVAMALVGPLVPVMK